MIPESSFDWLVFILLVLSSIGSMAQMSRFSALRDRTGDLERQLEALQEAHQKLTSQFFASLSESESK